MADKIVFGVEFDAKTGQAQLKTMVDGFEKFGNTAKLAGDKANQSFSQLIITTGQFTTILSNLKGAFVQVASQFTEVIALSNQYESALIGLAQTAEKFGESQTEAKKAAIELSNDGLTSVTTNATALKFLMQSGFDLSQSMNIATAAKDMGAFGRVTQDFNQAMIDFARGIKTGSLELTENIGFTQRFSAIMKNANVDINNGIDLRNNLAQREAFYNAVLKEGELVKGNAQKYLESTAGAMAQADTQINMLKKDIGDFVKIIVADMLPSIILVVKWLKENLAVVIAGLAAGIALTLIPAITTAISALTAMGTATALATGGISLLAGAIAAYIAYNFADELIAQDKAMKNLADQTQRYSDSLKTLTQDQILRQISELTIAIGIEEKRNSELYDKRVKQLAEIKRLEESHSYMVEQKRAEAETTKELIDRNAAVLKINKERLEIAKQQRDENIKARSLTVEPAEITEKQKKALEEIQKLRRQNRLEEAQESEKEADEIQKRLDDHIEKFKSANKTDLEDRIKLSENAMQAEMDIYLSGKSQQQIEEETWNNWQRERRKKTAEQWAQDNQIAASAIQGSMSAVSGGISAFISAGISGGNALKAAWQSFSQSILSMISQIVAKAIVMRALLAIGSGLGGGIGAFIGGLAAGEKGGLSSQFRPKLATGGVLWRGASHASGGIPVEVEGDEITLTKGVYRNPVLRGIASMINVAAGGVSIPNAPRASQLAAGGLPALSSGGGSSDNSVVLAMIASVSTAVNGLTEQMNRLKQTDERTVFTMSANGQKQIAAVL